MEPGEPTPQAMTAQTMCARLPHERIAANNTVRGNQKLPQRAWRDFRCHLGREALDLARLVPAMQERASVSFCAESRSSFAAPAAGKGYFGRPWASVGGEETDSYEPLCVNTG
jgi:hypothetical protein